MEYIYYILVLTLIGSENDVKAIKLADPVIITLYKFLKL